MISIFTTKNNLQSICLDVDKRPWLDMIIKLKEVFVNEEEIFSNEVDPEEDPFYILDGMQIDINSSLKEYINDISRNPEHVLEHPSSIFLLDISVADAQCIQKNYGVICQSIRKLDYKPLTQPYLPTELTERESGKSWASIIAQFAMLPSNSILIIDAHLFNEDKFDENKGCYDERKKVGIDNIFEILNCILPQSFQSIYHVGVLVMDMEAARTLGRSHSNLTNARIATAINNLKKKLRRNYVINMEVIFFDPRDDGYKLIHNRRILSNYFIVTAEYKLATIKDGISLCGQSIAVSPLFENIEINPRSDKKEKRIRSEIEHLSAFFSRQSTSHTALLYQNGRKMDDFLQMQHRFFH